LLGRNDIQVRVYKVVRTYLIATNTMLTQSFKEMHDIFLEQKDKIENILEKKYSSLQKLSESQVPTSISLSPKKVIDFLTEEKSKLNQLTEEYNIIITIKDEITKQLETINFEVQDIITRPLDHKGINIMNEKKELASEASKISRAKLNSMHTFKSQKQLNFSEYQNMLNVIIQKDRDSDEYNRDCCDAKVIETQNMMKNLFSMGKVIISIQEFLSAIDTLQSKLLSLEETIQLSLKITKYAQGYEECLKEIARRKKSLK